MPDREKVINAIECCIDGCLCAECDYEGIEGCWNKVLLTDALALLKEQEERKGNYVPYKVKTPTGKWNGEKCSVCGTEYIGSAPLQWKFCPDCGTKMEGR